MCLTGNILKKKKSQDGKLYTHSEWLFSENKQVYHSSPKFPGDHAQIPGVPSKANVVVDLVVLG